MEEGVMYLFNGPDGAGWYWISKDWIDYYGPFSSKELAINDQRQNKSTTAGQFWVSQFESSRKGEIVHEIPNSSQQKAIWELDIKSSKVDRVYLKEIADLHKLSGLVDAGYLSFVYGSRMDYGGWVTAKLRYGDCLLLMDSGGVRSKEYPLYKSRRQERRDTYDYMAETYEKVKVFRSMLIMDPMVNTAILEGYEADDLIAILFIHGIGNNKVIAQDKDLFMIPGAQRVMTDHTGVSQSHRDLKLPKYAIRPNKPATWALTQAIFGDKSDSIPRLLPSKRGYKELYRQCINEAPTLLQAFWNCYAEFGDQFIINLRLVLLPHPTLSNFSDDYDHLPNLLFQDLSSGKYWSPENYSDELLAKIVESTNIEDKEWTF